MLYAVGVFFAILVFQFSIVLSLVIAILLLMVDIEVYGLLYLLGAKLNGKMEQISWHSSHFSLNYAFHLLFLTYWVFLLSSALSLVNLGIVVSFYFFYHNSASLIDFCFQKDNQLVPNYGENKKPSQNCKSIPPTTPK